MKSFAKRAFPTWPNSSLVDPRQITEVGSVVLGKRRNAVSPTLTEVSVAVVGVGLGETVVAGELVVEDPAFTKPMNTRKRRITAVIFFPCVHTYIFPWQFGQRVAPASISVLQCGHFFTPFWLTSYSLNLCQRYTVITKGMATYQATTKPIKNITNRTVFFAGLFL